VLNVADAETDLPEELAREVWEAAETSYVREFVTDLRKIMATATDAEYGKVSLAVIEREGGAVPATARTASLTN